MKRHQYIIVIETNLPGLKIFNTYPSVNYPNNAENEQGNRTKTSVDLTNKTMLQSQIKPNANKNYANPISMSLSFNEANTKYWQLYTPRKSAFFTVYKS